MAVTSGSYTVGSGGDYPTWGGAAGAVADVANLTSNLTFTQTTATTETAAAAVYNKAIGDYVLTYDSATPHLGDPTSGLLTSFNYGGATYGFLFSNCTFGTGHISVKNLYTKDLAPGIATHYGIIQAANSGLYNFDDLLIDCDGISNRGIFEQSENVDIVVNLKNVNIWDCNIYAYAFQSLCTPTFENCNAYSGANGFSINNIVATLNNCTSCDNTGDDFRNIGNSTGNNNSSSDATAGNANWVAGANNLINQVTSACVQSLDDTSDDFFSILSAGPWDGTGITNTLDRERDIRGVKVPGINGTSMGVSETNGTLTLNLGDSNINIDGNFNSSVYNGAASIIDSDAAIINIEDDLTLGTSSTWNTSGLDYITFDGSTSSTTTLNSNTIGNVVVNKTGGSSVTLQDAFSCYALTALSGDFDQNGQTITTSGDQIYTGGGTLTLDTSSTMTKDGDFVVSSGWNTVNVSAAELDLQGTGVIQNDSGSTITFNKLKLAKTGEVTTNNGSTGIITNTLVLSGTLINNQEIVVSIDLPTDLSLGSSNIISGTSAFIIEATSAMTLEVSAMNVSAFNAPLHIRTQLTTSAGALTLNGDLNTNGDLHLYRYGGGNSVINTDENLTIGGAFYVGN